MIYYVVEYSSTDLPSIHILQILKMYHVWFCAASPSTVAPIHFVRVFTSGVRKWDRIEMQKDELGSWNS